MRALELFLPLAKVDEAQRLVYGVMTAEAPDKSGEIMDYASGKLAIQKWSGDCFARTDGASYGNVRYMHTKDAVGLLKSIEYDDDAKEVRVCAFIEDDAAWGKVMRKVLTGFSIGGGYAKRWVDATNRMLKRYTPLVSEVSLVDNPCLGDAVFQLIKADGTVVEERFNTWAPANEDVKVRAGELAKAAGKEDRPQDFLVAARDELIKAGPPASAEETAISALLKAAGHSDPGVAGDAVRVQLAREILAKADTLEDAEELAKAWTPGTADPAAALEALLNKDAGTADPPAPAPVVADEDVRAAIGLMKAVEEQSLEKGFWTVQRSAGIADSIIDLCASITSEERYENDTASPLPQMALDIANRMKALVVAMANEEYAEFERACKEMGGDIIVLTPYGDAVLAAAAKVTDLMKSDSAFAERMEKIGAAISAANKKHVQSIHDHASSLGADCAAEKMAKLEGDLGEAQAELARSRTLMAKAAPKMEELMAKVATMGDQLGEAVAKIAKLEKAPAPGKGALFAVPKEQDGQITPTPAPTDRRTDALQTLAKAGFHYGIPAPGGG